MVENIYTKTFWKKAGEKQKQQKNSLCMDIPAKIPKNNVTDTKRVKNKEDYDDDEKENDIVLPYEILPIGITIVEKFELE